MRHPCPECHTEGYGLERLTAESRVDYYRCSKCGHVWTTPKGRSGPIRLLTIVKKARKPKDQSLRVRVASVSCRSMRLRRALPLDEERRRLVRRTLRLGEQTSLCIRTGDLRALRRLRRELHALRADLLDLYARRIGLMPAVRLRA